MVTHEEILAGLADIVNDIAGRDVAEVTAEKSFTDDLDIDSLEMVEIVYAAEEKFGIEIGEDAVKTLKTVGDAADCIAKALAEKA